MVLNELELLDTVWSLVLPNAAIFFNIILMVNFFRSIPKGMEEAAIVDGASQFTILFRIYLPVKGGVATLLLFIIVFHWNSWFDGLIYMNSPDKYPLQSYLSTLILPINVNMLHGADGSSAAGLLRVLSEKSIKAANVFLSALPIMLVYPFLQKYFIKGLMLGSLKEQHKLFYVFASIEEDRSLVSRRRKRRSRTLPYISATVPKQEDRSF